MALCRTKLSTLLIYKLLSKCSPFSTHIWHLWASFFSLTAVLVLALAFFKYLLLRFVDEIHFWAAMFLRRILICSAAQSVFLHSSSTWLIVQTVNCCSSLLKKPILRECCQMKDEHLLLLGLVPASEVLQLLVRINRIHVFFN